MRKSAAIVVGGAALALVAGMGGAEAKSLITTQDLATGSVDHRVLKDGAVHQNDLSQPVFDLLHRHGARGPQGPAGQRGPQGPAGKDGTNGTNGTDGKDGDSYLQNAYYAVAFYDVGDTNAGAIATVACNDPSDTAVSGGVQVTGIGDTQGEIDAANARNTPVSSSFPGRMDWSTNSPKAGRLDGWIVQFGGTDKAPEKVKVWALCVPDLTIPVVNTYTESQ